VALQQSRTNKCYSKNFRYCSKRIQSSESRNTFFFIFVRTMPQLQIPFVVLRAASYSKRWSQFIRTAGAATIHIIQESRFPLKTAIFTSYRLVHTTSCRVNYNFNSKTTYNVTFYYTKLPFGTTARHGIPTTD